MKYYELDLDQAFDSLRALAMVARSADSGLAQPQRAVLDAIQRCLLGTDIKIEKLAEITHGELAKRFLDPLICRQLIQQMIIVSLADGAPSKAQAELISSFAVELQVREPAVRVIGNLAAGHRLKFRLGFYRRSHLLEYFGTQFRTQGGLPGVIKGILGFRGLIENRVLAARFHALEHLPAETLGYHFFQHCKTNALSFPGEKGGFPVGAVWHDFGHVLGAYDTSPEGEILAAAFQAGYRQNENAFFTMLFALLIHTAGINMAPFAMPVLKGRIGNGDLAEKMFDAWLKGAATSVDIGADWDFWPYVNMLIDLVREQLARMLHEQPSGGVIFHRNDVTDESRGASIII